MVDARGVPIVPGCKVAWAASYMDSAALRTGTVMGFTQMGRREKRTVPWVRVNKPEGTPDWEWRGWGPRGVYPERMVVLSS